MWLRARKDIKMDRWGSWDWDTIESIEALEFSKEIPTEEEQQDDLCLYCGGTALSPYEWDGGSCPHCFNGKASDVS